MKVVIISNWLKFGRPASPAVGRKFLAPSYYSQHAVFALPLSAFFILWCVYTPMARYSLFVLKVPLNTNQLTNQLRAVGGNWVCDPKHNEQRCYTLARALRFMVLEFFSLALSVCVARWPSGCDAGLVINRSRVRIPASPLSSATLGKLLTHMCFVTKQYNLVLANGHWCLAAGKVTVGLASHWPRVSDISGSPPTGSRPRRGRWAPAYALLVEYGELCLYLTLSVSTWECDIGPCGGQ